MTRRKTFQTGSVKLHNGNWTLRYRELDHAQNKWKTRRLVLGKFKDRKDALKAAAPIMAQVNERNNAEPRSLRADITFQEFIATRWKAYTVQEKHQISTLDLRDSLIRTHLMPFFGKMKMCRIEPTHIADFLEERRKDYTDCTMVAIYSLLHLIFDLAEQYDLIEKSPVRPKRHRPKTEKTTKPTLSAAQIREVIRNLSDEQERLLVLLLSVTGLRVQEAMALRWMDFDAEGCEISIRHTLYKGKLKKPKTEGSSGRVKLHPSIAALLAFHSSISMFSESEDFIFSQPDGRPLDYWTSLRRLHSAIEKTGIRIVRSKHGFHIFRHSAGTLLYTRSRDLKLVQGTLRHSEISTTSDIYVHLEDRVLREGTEMLTEEILTNCDLFVTQKRETAS